MSKITGKKLIELGYKPAKWFGEALEQLNSWEDQYKKDALIKSTCDYYVSLVPKEIEPFKESVEYLWNMEATTKDELENNYQVILTMEEVMKTPTVVTGAVMPDACPTGELGQIPVGGVVVTKNTIHPSMHSADVCCSVMATNFGNTPPKDVLDIANNITQFGVGGRKGYGDWGGLLENNKSLYERLTSNYFTKDYVVKALTHLGTQGDGNHFLFVGASESTGDTWMVTHHGSRGFGANVYKKGLHSAQMYTKKVSPKTLKRNAWLDYNTEEGELYWEALQIVREWTKLNHSSIHNKVADKLRIWGKDNFWNEHNFVFKDGDLFYHAKGATPLLDKFVPDSYCGRRLIPLNMAQPVLVVKGKENENNLGFAPHGAGRNISRSEHKRRLEKKNISVEEALKLETEGLDVRFYSGKPDTSELPSAYKDAEEVQKQIEKFGLGTVIDRIMPYGCIMAGEQEKRW